MDFPIAELMDEDACYQKLLNWLHPDGLACPRCGARDGPGRPSPPPRPRPRLPLQGLPSGLQRLHRHGPAGLPAAGRRADADPPRLRPGRPHRPAGPRAGLRPQGIAPAAAPAPARRLAVPRPVPAGRPGGGGRRDVPERGGKKACRTPTRSTRRGGGRTRPAATAPGTATGRRSAGSWAGTAAGSGCRSSGTPTPRRSTGWCVRRPSRRPGSTPTTGGDTTGWPRPGTRGPRSAIPRGSGRGTTTGTGCARSTTTRRRGCGRGCGTSCGRSAG